MPTAVLLFSREIRPALTARNQRNDTEAKYFDAWRRYQDAIAIKEAPAGVEIEGTMI